MCVCVCVSDMQVLVSIECTVVLSQCAALFISPKAGGVSKCLRSRVG